MGMTTPNPNESESEPRNRHNAVCHVVISKRALSPKGDKVIYNKEALRQSQQPFPIF